MFVLSMNFYKCITLDVIHEDVLICLGICPLLKYDNVSVKYNACLNGNITAALVSADGTTRNNFCGKDGQWRTMNSNMIFYNGK